MERKQFELTGRCNLECEFCYNKDYLKEWKRLGFNYVVDKAGSGNLILLGGGEPMLYPRIEKLIEKLLENENIIVAGTNGTIYKELPKSGRLQIQVDMPAFDEYLYREITKKGRNVKKVMKNTLKYKDEHDIVLINFPAYEKNFNEIDRIADFCKENDLPLVVSQIIPSDNIKPVDEKVLKEKCLENKLKGVDLIFTPDRKFPKEYYCPDIKAKVRNE